MASPFLSKSKYLTGMQCLKYLWLQANDPDKVPQPDAATQRVFDQGHLVERLARRLFPEGVEIPFGTLKGNARLTQQRLRERRTFFQAGMMAGNLYSRLDVLKPSGASSWDIYEIKSAGRVKDENVHDLSFQRHCCRLSGLAIDRCCLVHINSDYVLRGEVDPEKLFEIEDITADVDAAAPGIERRIETMIETLASAQCPQTRIGPQCRSPYECTVTLCHDSLPDNTILDLYRGGAKAFDLFHQGVRYLREIPEGAALTPAQAIQKWCDANSCAYVDGAAIKAFMDTLEYPVHYLDFETFNTAVPLYEGTHPYENIPFQFSVHVVDRPGMMPWQFSFLAAGPQDPRRDVLDGLQKAIGDRGSVVVYSKSFEDAVLRRLGEAFPERSGWTQGVAGRLVDLLQPFRQFSYYSPAQKGSASLKNVMPALTGRGYSGLAIAKGDDASLAYLAMSFGKMADDEKKKTRAQLEEYCGLDTAGMITIVERLAELAGVQYGNDTPPGRRRRPPSA